MTSENHHLDGEQKNEHLQPGDAQLTLRSGMISSILRWECEATTLNQYIECI